MIPWISYIFLPRIRFEFFSFFNPRVWISCRDIFWQPFDSSKVGIQMFIGNLKQKCCVFSYVRTADMYIARVRVRSVGVDVSIAGGIQMFIWGKAKAEMLCFFICPHR